MHYVSLIVEFLRGRPAVVFWTAALGQAALWFALPSLFYSAPPAGLAAVLTVGRELQLGSYLGPPLAFWLAELAFKAAGLFGVYLLAQVCVVTALWAVFRLGTAIVGARHAALAVLLMVGISVLSLPTPDFGPAVLAMPLWALTVLHYWRAAGEDQRGYWLLLAVELGLLLLTSFAGVILVVSLVAFTLADSRARATLRHIEPWLAILFVLFIVAPYAVWLVHRSDLAWIPLTVAPSSGASAALHLAARIVLAHVGLCVLVLLASGWPRRRRELPPLIDGQPASPHGRLFVYFFAVAPALTALGYAAWAGAPGPLQQTSPLLLLSGLAAIVAAGASIKLYRERLTSFAWLGLLVAPPALIVLGFALLPWLFATDFQVAQPASAMGRYFGESFERRTGQPLRLVAGDERIASLVALAAPSRPSVLLDATPARSPWATVEQFRERGGILVWPATDTAGAPPQALREKFPDLVAEVPRVFERAVQGRLPLMRIGWAVIRPAASPPSPAQPQAPAQPQPAPLRQ